MRVDLGSRRPAGSPGEGDRLKRIEDAIGTAGRDRLAGDSGPNRLYGRGGRDLLIGRGGRDRLAGGNGGGQLVGSPDRVADRLLCGRGSDLVVDPALEPLSRGCERLASSAFIHLDGETIRAQPRLLGRRRYGFEAICSPQALSCRRRIVLVYDGRVVGRSRLVTARPQRMRLVVRAPRPLPTSGVLEVRTVGPQYFFRFRLYL